MQARGAEAFDGDSAIRDRAAGDRGGSPEVTRGGGVGFDGVVAGAVRLRREYVAACALPDMAKVARLVDESQTTSGVKTP